MMASPSSSFFQRTAKICRFCPKYGSRLGDERAVGSTALARDDRSDGIDNRRNVQRSSHRVVRRGREAQGLKRDENWEEKQQPTTTPNKKNRPRQ